MCDEGVATEELIQQAIRHFRLEPFPPKTHLECRHKRWGASYELCFELATIIALTYENRVQIANHPVLIQREIDAQDPNRGMKENPGAFIIQGHENSKLLCGDGRLLDGSGENLWEKYMLGATIESLVKQLASGIGAIDASLHQQET